MPRAKSTRNGTPRTSAPEAAPAVTSPEVKQNASHVDLEAEIRRRAYELYAQRGYVSGHENEDWIVAEREVLARYNLQQSA
jgi:Protein of unknown function (DUF2934)